MRNIPPSANQWPTRRLGDLLVRHNEIIHPGDRKGGEATFVGLEHIEPNTGRRIGSLTIDLGKLTGRKPTFRRGQIVYGYLRPYLNKVWIADFDGCSSVDQFAFDVRQDLADTNFIAAFMRSETFLRRSEVVTTTGQLPRISVDEIAAVPIDLPSLADQQRIATELKESSAAVNTARCAVEHRLAAAEALPTAYLRGVFEGLEANSWKTARIEDVAPIQTGLAFKSGWFVEAGGVRILRNANIHQGFVEWTDVVSVGYDLFMTFHSYSLNSGDIVLTLDRPIVANGLKVARLSKDDVPALLNQRVARFKAMDSRIDPDYLYAFLRSPAFTNAIRGHDQSLGVPHISPQQVGQVEIPLPPIAVQKSVVVDLSRQLESAELLIARCRQELAAIGALPASLSRAAFNGDS